MNIIKNFDDAVVKTDLEEISQTSNETHTVYHLFSNTG